MLPSKVFDYPEEKIPTLNDILDKTITTQKQLVRLLYKVIFLRNYILWPDHRSYPHVNVFTDDHTNWWSWMNLVYQDLVDDCLGNVDIKFQIDNIIDFSAIIKNPWISQTEIVIGCGQGSYHNHEGQYTVDINPEVDADCYLLFGHYSLANVIPQAKGKIVKIILEGIIISENPCFEKDILELLDDGGEVCIDNCYEGPIPIIRKVDDRLFVIKDDILEPYKSWDIEMTDSLPKLVDLGSDALGWSYQIEKVTEENARGVWDHLPKNPMTPFDPMFGNN